MKTGALAGGPLKYVKDFVDVPTGVVGNITGPKIVIDKNDKVHIIYRLETDLRLHYINNISGSFSTPIPITPPGQRPAFAQNFSIDDSGRVYVVYQSSVAASGRGFYFVYSDQGIFSDTLLVYNLSPEYVTRNSSAVISRGNGDMALFYAPGGIRNSEVICDIFMRRGNINDIIPIELISFNADEFDNDIHLSWITASEINNKGFEILRFAQNDIEWKNIAFVDGKGTTTEIQHYSSVDSDLNPGFYSYRLKQIDFDGSFEYSDIVEAEIGAPEQFILYQNYPNPFNPKTNFGFRIADFGFVSLKIYDLLGSEVATLVNEEKQPGFYEIEFSAKGGSASGGDAYNLPSGTYFYKLTSGEFTSIKKFVLLK
ncbi:MAG TPA: T9SS type A sorting domain-containing protein, partial [Ignavibacteriaceae bacterium]